VLVFARQGHGGSTAAGKASENRHAEARIAPEKETAGNSRKGSLFVESTESKKSTESQGF
jgi:hypothetical protein